MKKYLSLVVVVLLLACAGSAFASSVGGHGGTQQETTVVNETPATSPNLSLQSGTVQTQITTGLGSDAAGLTVVDMTNDPDTAVTNPSSIPTQEKTALVNLANSSSTKPKVLNILAKVVVTVKKVVTSAVNTTQMNVGDLLQFFGVKTGNRAVSVEAAAESGGITYSFLDKDGNTIERVPEDKIVNLAVVAEPGNEYTLAVGAGEIEEEPTKDPGSSGGGCSAGFTALALAVLGGFIAARKK